MGIIGANLMVQIYPKFTLGLTGNTIIGVFGSVLFIKSLGRIGVDPKIIMADGQVSIHLLILNFVIAILGGGISLAMISLINKKIQKNNHS